MILPVYAYGHGVLTKEAIDIDKDYKGLSQLLDNMWETMYGASGVGLAAPQIGLGIRVFMVDTLQLVNEESSFSGCKKVFINARKLEEKGPEWSYEEGCLSIPKIRAEVERQAIVKMEYLDENFEKHIEEFDGINARVIQHEYDHIEGILFTDKIKPLRKKLIKKKLENIKKGKVDIDYRMKFPIKR